MSIKKKLGMGVVTAALGISLIGGGTFAYFNDTESVNNTFAAGTLDLGVNPEIAFALTDLKPGDYMTRSFNMTNEGTLDIARVLMNTSFEGTADFANHLVVDFLTSDGKTITELSGKTIAELAEIENTDITPGFRVSWWPSVLEGQGIPVGTDDTIRIKITFNDEGDQNHLQGANLDVTFDLEAQQTTGVNRTSNN